jgi:DNA-binding response OmpR family regulator
MPARIVVVHDDAEYLDELAAGLRTEGYEVATYPDPIAAWDALEAARKTEVLVTRLGFPPGRSNGMALSRMAKSKRRDIKVLFLTSPENAEEVEDMGTLIVAPAPTDAIVEAVKQSLGEP